MLRRVVLRTFIASALVVASTAYVGAADNLIGTMSCDTLPEQVKRHTINAGHVGGPPDYDAYLTGIDDRYCKMLKRDIEIADVSDLNFLFFFVESWEAIYNVDRVDLLRGKEDEIAKKDADTPATVFRFKTDKKDAFHNVVVVNLGAVSRKYRGGSEYIIPYRIMMVFDWENPDRVAAFSLSDLRK